MRFAAIDVGSNAVRLLLARVFVPDNGEPMFKKESLIRIPLRLGDDAFVRKQISKDKSERLVHTMRGFSALMDAYQPISYRACATSAMREAENGAELAARVAAETGVELEIVDGDVEASIIYANHIERQLSDVESCLYIDVGGGSTEITIFSEGTRVDSRSFPLGTIRVLENLVTPSLWRDLRDWVKKRSRKLEGLAAIGSGGNINKIFRMAGCEERKPLTFKRLKKIRKTLEGLSYEQRITTMNLRPDRADVIVPASQIFESVMKWGQIRVIYVPQVGLADGVIHELYEREVSNRQGVERSLG